MKTYDLHQNIELFPNENNFWTVGSMVVLVAVVLLTISMPPKMLGTVAFVSVGGLLNGLNENKNGLLSLGTSPMDAIPNEIEVFTFGLLPPIKNELFETVVDWVMVTSSFEFSPSNIDLDVFKALNKKLFCWFGCNCFGRLLVDTFTFCTKGSGLSSAIPKLISFTLGKLYSSDLQPRHILQFYFSL